MVCSNCISFKRKELVNNLNKFVHKKEMNEDEKKIIISFLISMAVKNEIEYSLNRNLMEPLNKALKEDFIKVFN